MNDTRYQNGVCQSRAKTCLLPARPDLDGLCVDCFRIIHLETLLNARKHLLLKLSIVEQDIARCVERIDTVPRDPGRPSVLHRCVCGYADPSYIQVDVHIADFDDPAQHRHEMREIIPPRPASRAASQQPRAAVRDIEEVDI